MKAYTTLANSVGKLIALCLFVSTSLLITSCKKTADVITPAPLTAEQIAISTGVPVTVADAFFAQYPTAAPISWQAVDGLAYETKFVQASDTLCAFVKNDGTFLDGGMMIATSNLPAAITTYLQKTFVGGVAKESIIYQQSKTLSGYKVIEQTADNRLSTVAFDKSGAVLSTNALYAFGRTDYFGMKPDSVTQANLPANIQSYLTTNYADYTFAKAFKQKNVDGSTKGYGVVLKAADGTSLATSFDANGNFLKANKVVARSMRIKPDSLTANNMPAAIASYLTSNYANYAFLKGYILKNTDSTIKGYVVRIMKSDSSKVGVSFDANSNFLKELTVKKAHARPDSVAQASLPASIGSYLTTNYAGYTFGKAFSVKDTTGSIANYVVIIQANGNTYSTVFDGQGTFVTARQVSVPDVVATADIPVTVSSYLTANFAGYTNLQVIRLKVDGILVGYQARLRVGTTPHLLYFDAQGNFVSEATIKK